MFDQLDIALSALLREPGLQATLPELYAADTSFVTPENGYAPDPDALNLFLYETKENRELREAWPMTRNVGGISTRRRAPLRVDCSYMVTAWSTQNGIDKVAAEHKLLGQAFQWLSRFPTVPLRHFALAARPGQEFDPPTMVAQMDGAKSAGEFWHALGIPPRPYFNLMVTITMDLDQAVEDALVTTITSQYHAGDAASAEERLIVGGTVRDPYQQPVPDAWVRMEPRGDTTVTNALGRFVFEHATRGTGHTLRARATGFSTEALRTNLQVPSPSGEYDLTFP